MQMQDLYGHLTPGAVADLMALAARGEAAIYEAPHGSAGPILWVVNTRYSVAEYAALARYGTHEDGRHQIAPPGAFLAFLEAHERAATDPDDLEMRNGCGWLVQFLWERDQHWHIFHEGAQPAISPGGSDWCILPIIPFTPFERHVLTCATSTAAQARDHVLAWLHGHERGNAA